MMKKITLLLALLISSIGFSQDLKLGFETAESGGLNGNPFGNGNAMQANLVTDAGTNGTQVLEVIANSAGEVWQGVNMNLTSNVDLSTTQTMTIDVFSATAVTFLVKVNGGVSGAPEAAAEVTHDGNSTWQTLSFTFNTALDGKAAAANGVYSSFVLHCYWKAGETGFGGVVKDERTFYLDNIKGPSAPAATCSDGIQNGDETGIDCGGSCPNACPGDPEPMDAPTTPIARNAQDVISLYGDSYGTATGFNGVPWDNGSDAAEGSYAGNNALKITNGTGDFIGFDVANTAGFVDASAMTHIHADFWIAGDYVDGQVLKVKLSNHTGGSGETNAIIPEIFPTAGDMGTWISIDAELGANARERITQVLLIYTNSATAPGIVYTDNIYMYRAATAGVDKNNLLNVSLSPSPAKNELKISAKNTIENVTIYNVLGKKVKSVSINKNEDTIDVSTLNSGIYILKYTVDSKVGTMKFVKE